jgi:geranylgeranyl diphosphate synthase type II
MRYSVFAGGKRLRPVLALAAADAVARASSQSRPEPASANSGICELALPAACAIELIHTYSLIHDDLPAMDNDTLRRGRPTLHVVYGDAVAILAGDGLQAEAFALLAREPQTNEPAIAARKLRVVGLIGRAAGSTGMVGGQTIDVQAAGQVSGHLLSLDADGLRAMHAGKTGALITAAAESGAVMAGGTDAMVGALREYAAHLGLAFQIIDDVLDVEGSAEALGKTAGKDARQGKPTFPAFYGVAESRRRAEACITRAQAALAGAGLGGRLADIAEWSLTRTK